MVGFIIGLAVGAAIGVVVMALMNIASQTDRQMEEDYPNFET